MRTKFTGGKIYLGQGRFAESIDVVDGRIVPSAEEADQVVDLQGATVIPGLNDAHLHLLSLGSALSMLDLRAARSVEELIEIAGSAPPEQSLIEGRGWNQDYFSVHRLPSMQELDSISPDRPLFLTRVCGHIALVNSKALQLAGIDAQTPDPQGGRFVRDEKGDFTGEIQENALHYVRERLPSRTVQEMKQAILSAIDHVLAQGVTSVQSNDISDDNYTWLWPLFREIKDLRALRIHEQLTLTCRESLEALCREREHPAYDSRLSLGPIKVFKDGSLGGRTALLKEDYRDAPATKGVRTYEQGAFITLCRQADALGVPMICHAIGDQAIEEVLDAYREVRPVHTGGIVHCQITGAELLEQLMKEKPMLYVQPVFLSYDMHIAYERVGEKAKTSYAFASLYRAGVPLALSTDAPVEDSHPFENIYCAVTRKDLSGSAQAFCPEEGMRITEAIDAYTYGSALVQGKAHEKGLLLPGYLADFVVLDRDIFTVDAEQIRNIKPLAVYIDGKKV